MATTNADNLFGAKLKELRRKLVRDDYIQPEDVRNAVISTIANATARYLEGLGGIQYNHSGSNLRKSEMMEKLRQELVKFFGPDVKVRKNPNYRRGITITINFNF
jgi:hypothetical protein